MDNRTDKHEARSKTIAGRSRHVKKDVRRQVAKRSRKQAKSSSLADWAGVIGQMGKGKKED